MNHFWHLYFENLHCCRLFFYIQHSSRIKHCTSVKLSVHLHTSMVVLGMAFDAKRFLIPFLITSTSKKLISQNLISPLFEVKKEFPLCLIQIGHTNTNKNCICYDFKGKCGGGKYFLYWRCFHLMAQRTFFRTWIFYYNKYILNDNIYKNFHLLTWAYDLFCIKLKKFFCFLNFI